jgi:RNA polymerase sigma-70 factor, ECF subfamily
MGDITRLLARWKQGDARALEELTPIVYQELRQLANHYMRRESSDHTLQPTALVHEAWLRLSRQDQAIFEHRKRFYALAAQVMRRILVDHARAVNADKRGGGLKTTLDDAMAVGHARTVELIALDQALDRLAALSPRQVEIVQLRYFAGLNVEEMADVLGVSPSTVSRDQKTAEAWLGHVLSGPPA